MGTVEKIVEVLNNMCNDKKAQATSRYEEHSTWLSSEFSSIRNLIQPAAVETTMTSNSASSATRQKRKSPETCSAGSRNSPLHKRNSGADINIAELLVAQNLPADLTKLKKEQLLEHMNSRGCVDMTMKALKKDMVDRLKELVIDIHRRSIPVIPEELSKQDPEPDHIEEDEIVEVEDIVIKEEIVVSHEKEQMEEEKEEKIDTMKSKSDQREGEEHNELVVSPLVDSVSLDIEQDDDDVHDDKMDSSPEQEQEQEQPLETAAALAPPPRKKSILSEYRQQMTATSNANANSSATTTTASAIRSSMTSSSSSVDEADTASRVQSEFEARRLRHRMSQAGGAGRPSTSSGNSITALATSEQVQSEEVNMQQQQKMVAKKKNSTEEEASEEELPLQSCMQPTTTTTTTTTPPESEPELELDSLVVDMETDHDEEGGNWNEVPSPKRGNSVEDANAAATGLQEEVKMKMKGEMHMPTPVAVGEVRQPKQTNLSLKENDDGEKAASKAVKTVTASTSSSASTSAAKPLNTASSSVPAPALAKKPNNLIGGTQLSFLNPSKTSAPAGTASAASAASSVAGGKTKTVVSDCSMPAFLFLV